MPRSTVHVIPVGDAVGHTEGDIAGDTGTAWTNTLRILFKV